MLLSPFSGHFKPVSRSCTDRKSSMISGGLVLSNIKAVIEQLNKKLNSNGGKAKLSFWGKVKWPLQREESVVLQQNMQACMQMMGFVQNAFLQ
jgi:hypothetical protein